MTPTELDTQLLRWGIECGIAGLMFGIIIGLLICWWRDRNIIVGGRREP